MKRMRQNVGKLKGEKFTTNNKTWISAGKESLLKNIQLRSKGNKTDELFLFTQTTCLFTKIERTT